MVYLNAKRLIAYGSLCAVMGILASCGGSSGDGGGSTSACSELGLGAGERIAAGELCLSADQGSTTSVVQLTIVSNDGSEGACTGTVISPTTVLTASHCVTSIDDETGTIADGDLAGVVLTFVVNGEKREFAEPASNILIHPGFVALEPGYFFNDVTVIRTSQPIPAPAVPILASRPPSINEEAIVAGYGQIEHDGPAQDDLSAGNARIRQVTDHHVIINFTGDESHPCQGDSGGAMFVREGGELVIAGVVSQSDPGVDEENICRRGDRSLYANVQWAETAEFIRSVSPDSQYR